MTSSERQEHIQNFKRALLGVSPEYFGIPAMNDTTHINERAFAYELYHQLRNTYTGTNWYVNGELRKGLSFMPNYGQDNTLIPDLVIHKHATLSQNIIAVEIKSSPTVTGPEIVQDLEKLEIYTRPGEGYLNYQLGIMLIINYNFKEKFSRMDTQSKRNIIHFINFHRIAIWNITHPIVYNEAGTTTQLDSRCLEIIRAKDLDS